MESAGNEETIFKKNDSLQSYSQAPVLMRKASWEVRRHSPSSGGTSANSPGGRKFSDLFPDDLKVDNKDLATEIQKLEDEQHSKDLKILEDIKSLRREKCRLCRIKWEVQQALNVATNSPSGGNEPIYEEVEAQCLRDANLEEGKDQENLIMGRDRDWAAEIETEVQSCMEYECQLSKLKESLTSMDKTAEYNLRTKLVRSTSNLRPRFEMALPDEWNPEEENLEDFMDVTINEEGCLEGVEPTGWAFQEAGLKKNDYVLAIFFGEERQRVTFSELGNMDEDVLEGLWKKRPVTIQFLPNAENLS